MAGIGFELKKLFRRKGIFASFRAYGYAGVICTGPMLLGVLRLLSVMFLCILYNVSEHSRELIICVITYALLGSLQQPTSVQTQGRLAAIDSSTDNGWPSDILVRIVKSSFSIYF